MPESYFVTGATGAQGGAVTRSLLEAGRIVHAIVRDPSASSAKSLEAAGVKIFHGSFDDVGRMTEAARGCVGAFLNVSPVFTDPHGEEKHAKNVLAACQAAGTVQVIVQSSVRSVGAYEQGDLSGVDPNTSPMAGYFAGKLAVETLVKQSSFKSWAIVRPPRLLNSYIAPLANFMFPAMKSEGKLVTALSPDLRQTVTDPGDIGIAATNIFRKEELWNKTHDLSGEFLTMAEIVRAINSALGAEKVKLQFYSPEEVQDLLTKNPIIASELFLNANQSALEREEKAASASNTLGFTPGLAVDYFKKEKETLLANLPH